MFLFYQIFADFVLSPVSDTMPCWRATLNRFKYHHTLLYRRLKGILREVAILTQLMAHPLKSEGLTRNPKGACKPDITRLGQGRKLSSG